MEYEVHHWPNNRRSTAGVGYEPIAAQSNHDSTPMAQTEGDHSYPHAGSEAIIDNEIGYHWIDPGHTGEAFGNHLFYEVQRNEYHSEPYVAQTGEEPILQVQQALVDGSVWSPICLRKWFLFGQAAVFVLALIATAVLYSYSQQHHGIVSQMERYHYWWKYGPTALLTMITFIWTYIDVSVKSLMPWYEMDQGPAAADRSLLLDYFSPILPTSLWHATKNKHWAVTLSLTGYSLLLLTTAFSTSLLQLELTEVKRETPLNVTRFNGDAYAIGNVDSNAAYLFYGTRFENLPYPPGTTVDTVVPTFALNNETLIPTDATITATVTGAKAEMECESYVSESNATVSQISLPWVSVTGAFFAVNITRPGCDISGIIIGRGPDHGFQKVRSSRQNYQASVDDYVCNLDNWSYEFADLAELPPPDEIDSPTAEHRVIFTIADVRHEDADAVKSPKVWVNNFTMLICKPSYKLNTYLVSYNDKLRTQDIQLKEKAVGAMIPGFYTRDLIRATLKSMSSLFVIDDEVDPDYLWISKTPIFWKLVELEAEVSNLGSLIKSDRLISSVVNVFKGTVPQVMGQMLLSPQNTTVGSGEAVFLEDRLLVKAQSMGVMIGAFAILVIISIALVFYRPHNVTPWKPGSIEVVDKTLASSPYLPGILNGLGSARLSQIREHLGQYTFETSLQGNTVVIKPMLRHDMTVFSASVTNNTDIVKWWRPFGSRGWFIGLCIAIPIILMGILEGIQQISDKHDGFLIVTSQNSEVLAYYIPAGISLVIGAMYGSLTWTASVFSPYASLVDGMAPASKSTVSNYSTRPGPAAWISSIKSRHFGLSVILVAYMVSSFITIAISGLYSFVQVPTITPITLQPDIFNITSLDKVNSDVQAGTTNNLVTYHGLHYPQWTYDTLVLPSFHPPANADQTPGIINLNTSALRPALNCTTVPSSSLNLKIETPEPYLPGYGIISEGTIVIVPGSELMSVTFSIPWALCDTPPAPRYRNQSSVSWLQHFYIRNDSITGRFGKATPLDWSNATTKHFVKGDGVGIDPGASLRLIYSDNPFLKGALSSDSNPWGCPSIALTVGTTKATQYKKMNGTTAWRLEEPDVGVLLCKQQVTRVQTTVSFSYPGFDIQSPPAVDESSVVLLENKVLGGTTFASVDANMWLSLRLGGDHLILDGQITKQEFDDRLEQGALYEDIDDFIWALVEGKDGVPFAQLTGEANIANLQEAAQRLSGRHRALSWTRHTRTSDVGTQRSGDAGVDDDDGIVSFSPLYQVSVSRTGSDTQRRIKQNAGPKIALQVMLGFMALCCAVAMTFLLRFAETLPHNPCSIAGTATLLVDGRESSVDGVHDYDDGSSEEGLPPASDRPLHRGKTGLGYEYQDVALDDESAANHRVDLYTMEWWRNQLGAKLFGIRRLRIEVEQLVVQDYKPSSGA